MSQNRAAERFLEHLRDWWQGRDGFAGLDAGEVERIAGDLGLSAGELRELAARGPHSADLLLERMAVLGLTKADVDHAAAGLMHELQRTCSHCCDKGVCVKDLADRPDDPHWQSYCPNVASLEAIAMTKHRLPH